MRLFYITKLLSANLSKENIALIVSFLAMLSIATSYFTKRKIFYLLLQGAGIIFLIASYFLTAEYFAMIGLGIGLFRVALFFFYEQANKTAPLYWAIVISFLTIASYCIVDLAILKKANLLDILYLGSLVGYAFVFRIRDLQKVRFYVLIPTCLAIAYNSFNNAPIFSCLSYVFELTANIVSIFIYRKKQKNYVEEK